jgi:RNA polymerase sigma factor (sigma-70 family)
VGAASKGETGNGILATLAAPGISATARSRSDVTDHDLVQAVRAGDDHAFERLYHRYHRRISAYIFGMVHDHGRAEDLTQEVFVSALRRMRQTDRPIAFKPWVYEIAKNACIDAFRRTKRTEEVSIDAEEGLAPADHGKLASISPSPERAVEGKQQLDDLCGAFGGLSDAHHQILVMRELEGLSYREIGERLGMSRASVESTLFRARRRLTEEYDELRTGARCLRIQEIIGRAVAGVGASAGALGTRDQRRVGSHISHCQPCRRHAVMAGMDAAALGRRTVRGKIAAFLPLPAILRKRWFGGDGGSDVAAAHAVHHGPALAQMSMAAAQYGEPSMGGWMKLTAVATAVALAGVGAGAVDHVASSGKHHDAPIAHAAPASAAKAPPATGAATGGARRTIATSTGATSSGHGSSGKGRKGTGGASGGTGFSGSGGTSSGTANGAGSGAAAPSTSSGGGGKSENASSASAGGPSTSTASKPAGGGAATGGAVQQAAGAVTGAVTGAADTATDTAAGATGGGSTAPLVDPNLGALTQPSSNPPPQTAGQVVSGATDTVGNTVGGQVGDVVKQTGTAVGSTVDNVTQGVTGAVGGLLGGK